MTNSDRISDTQREAAAAHVAALRRLGPAGRLRAGLRFSDAMIARSRAALRSRHPNADDRELLLLWLEQSYGAELARAVESSMKAVAWTSATTSS